MPRSHNLAFKEIAESQAAMKSVAYKKLFPAEDIEVLARKALFEINSPKWWGFELGVSHQSISIWKNGGAIPAPRQQQIIDTAKRYIVRDVHALERAIDRMLLENYGTADRGRF